MLVGFYAFFIGKLHRLLGEWLDSIIDNGHDDDEKQMNSLNPPAIHMDGQVF